MKADTGKRAWEKGAALFLGHGKKVNSSSLPRRWMEWRKRSAADKADAGEGKLPFRWKSRRRTGATDKADAGKKTLPFRWKKTLPIKKADAGKIKRLLLRFSPYVLFGLLCTNLGEAWRMADGADISERMASFFTMTALAFGNPLPSLYPADLLAGALCGAALYLAVVLKSMDKKKYRKNEEYGSARWGGPKDIEPFMDPVFENNVILTRTERLMMGSRPKDPACARNKNVLIVGGSGSGKTRFWIKPNLLQLHSSYVLTDPKGTTILEVGNAFVHADYRIKIFNTINFKKSMHFNPFAYVHSEKDILKLVTTLMANTKGEGKSSDPFWDKAETLLYCALIGYIHYEAPKDEQNFATLIEFINAMEVREDDEEYQNPVDIMFEALKQKKPDHFAVRQYAKFKLAAGVIDWG